MPTPVSIVARQGYAHLVPVADTLVREALHLLEQMGPHIAEEELEVERRLRLTTKSKVQLQLEVLLEDSSLLRCAQRFYRMLRKIGRFRADHPQVRILNLPWE